MKTFWIMIYKKFSIIAILLVVLMASCQKNEELFYEQETNDNFLDNENNNDENLFFDDIPYTLEQRTPVLPYNDDDSYDQLQRDYLEETLLYHYDGHWSMRFDEYFGLDNYALRRNNKEELLFQNINI